MPTNNIGILYLKSNNISLTRLKISIKTKDH